MSLEAMADKLKQRLQDRMQLVKVHIETSDTVFDQVFDTDSEHGRKLLLRAVIGTIKRHGTVTISEYND